MGGVGSDTTFTSKPRSAKRSPPVTVNAPVMITRAGAVCQGMVLCGERVEWTTGGGEKGGGGQIRAETSSCRSHPVVCVCGCCKSVEWDELSFRRRCEKLLHNEMSAPDLGMGKGAFSACSVRY